jgi:hypothetical protein
MEKSFLIDQVWSNRAIVGYKGSKTNLQTMSEDELNSLYSLLSKDNEESEESVVEESVATESITTLTNNKGVEIPVVMLPLVKVQGMSLYFQFGEQLVCVSNFEYVRTFNKGLIKIGQLMPFNFSMGINSFGIGIGGHLQALANTLSLEERKSLPKDEALAGKLLTSFVEGFASEQAQAREKQLALEEIKAKALSGLKGAERKAVQAEITQQIVDIKVSGINADLKALFA